MGVESQLIRIKKEGRCLQINVGGITVNSFFAFVEIYRFVGTYMGSIKAYM